MSAGHCGRAINGNGELMEKHIWDQYGAWDDIANLQGFDGIKSFITGNLKAWRPNFVPPALRYVFDYAIDEAKNSGVATPTILDFGCGLGRNAPMLGHLFPRVIGLDIEEMMNRMKSELPGICNIYSALYTSVDALVTAEDFCALYDSVVFQHLVDRQYLSELLDKLLSRPSFRTFVSLHNLGSPGALVPPDIATPLYLELLKERGWRLWHQEAETLSFEGAPHALRIFRRW